MHLVSLLTILYNVSYNHNNIVINLKLFYIETQNKYQSKMEITAIFITVSTNIALLISYVPDLTLTVLPWPNTPLRELLQIAVEWDSHIELANLFLSNTSSTPSPQMMDLLNEYKEVRGKSSWDNLNNELKVSAWKQSLFNDLNNIKISTRQHITSLGLR